jgi:beta-phosphoglucomutase-like phosphatase (HAD superfamily)
VTSDSGVRELAAVFFDMDGTLLDSEKVWDVALDDLAAHLGGSLSVPARLSMVGSSLGRSVAIVHTDLGVTADPAASAGYLTARTAELFRTHLVWKPGARELLDAVAAAGLPAALVTSTFRELTEIALDFMGRDYFAATVLLGVAAADSVAIEDSPLGIAAAEAAGCRVLAVPSEVPINPAPTRTLVASLRAVDLEFLRRLD